MSRLDNKTVIALKQLVPEEVVIDVEELPNDGQKYLIRKNLTFWSLAMHWLIREFNNTHQIPAKRSFMKLMEPRGRYLKELFELCSACHARQAQVLDKRLPYNDGADWFQKLYVELRELVVAEILFPPICTEKKRPTKESEIGVLRKHLRETRGFKNPYAHYQNLQHLSRLLKIATTLAEQSSDFNERHFRPFLNAWDDHLKMLDSPAFKRHEIVDGQAIMIGRGRYKRLVG